MKPKNEKITNPCSKCGGNHLVTGSVKLSTSNPWHVYKGSKHPWQHRDSARLCKKHFIEFEAKLRKLFYEY